MAGRWFAGLPLRRGDEGVMSILLGILSAVVAYYIVCHVGALIYAPFYRIKHGVWPWD